MEPRHPPASDRLQLEISVIRPATERAPEMASDESLGEPRRRVLLVVTDADVREYIAQCLCERTDLRVFELAHAGEATSKALRRVHPDLVIADIALLSDHEHGLEQSTVPLLLIGEERPQRLPASQASPAREVAVLVVPFNAQRLLEALEQFRFRR